LAAAADGDVRRLEDQHRRLEDCHRGRLGRDGELRCRHSRRHVRSAVRAARARAAGAGRTSAGRTSAGRIGAGRIGAGRIRAGGSGWPDYSLAGSPEQPSARVLVFLAAALLAGALLAGALLAGALLARVVLARALLAGALLARAVLARALLTSVVLARADRDLRPVPGHLVPGCPVPGHGRAAGYVRGPASTSRPVIV
jgi:hypothetical protein